MTRLILAASAALLFSSISIQAHAQTSVVAASSVTAPNKPEMKLACGANEVAHITYDFTRNGDEIMFSLSAVAPSIVGMVCAPGPAKHSIRGLPAKFDSLDDIRLAMTFIGRIADKKVANK